MTGSKSRAERLVKRLHVLHRWRCRKLRSSTGPNVPTLTVVRLPSWQSRARGGSAARFRPALHRTAEGVIGGDPEPPFLLAFRGGRLTPVGAG